MREHCGEKSCLFVKLLIYKSVVFFELEYFIYMLTEVSCDLHRNGPE